jgi:hypothetical protein
MNRYRDIIANRVITDVTGFREKNPPSALRCHVVGREIPPTPPRTEDKWNTELWAYPFISLTTTLCTVNKCSTTTLYTCRFLLLKRCVGKWFKYRSWEHYVINVLLYCNKNVENSFPTWIFFGGGGGQPPVPQKILKRPSDLMEVCCQRNAPC